MGFIGINTDLLNLAFSYNKSGVEGSVINNIWHQ
jgi:hypothetical protein